MVLLTYPDRSAAPDRTCRLNPKTKAASGRIRLGVLGVGAFARSAHLPNIQALSSRFSLRAVVSRTGHNAASAAKQFGAAYASTDYEEILSDPEVDAVIIATRHDLHAAMALAALEAGKHVLVEKPTALTLGELDALDTLISNAGSAPFPVLQTGYNSRFSKSARGMAELLNERAGPFIFNYRMNAGYIPPDHWVHGSEGGGRNLGEACHIYDLFSYLADKEVTEISAHAIAPRTRHYQRNDNFVATMSFADGSVATLTYTALGAKDYPKEMADLYVDGKIAVLKDYRSLDVLGVKGKSLKTTVQDKGLRDELIAFGDAINSGNWAIPWSEQLQAAQIAFEVEKQLHPLRERPRSESLQADED